MVDGDDPLFQVPVKPNVDMMDLDLDVHPASYPGNPFNHLLQTLVADDAKVAALHIAYDKWLAKDDPAFVCAHLPELPLYVFAMTAFDIHTGDILNAFMSALHTYWGKEHVQLLVDSKFFESLAVHLPDTICTHSHAFPIDGLCIMARVLFSCKP
jgi:hypothetical protein